MNTGENEQGLRAVTDLFRKGSIVLLGLHFYVHCYGAFAYWGLKTDFVERLLLNFRQTGILNNAWLTKIYILGLLILSLMGTLGKKDEKAKASSIITLLAAGLAFFFGSALFFCLQLTAEQIAVCYITVTSTGFILLLTGGARLSRLIKVNLNKDIFNEENETFPQEEQLLENEFSVNIPARYRYKGKYRKSWLNFVNPARHTLICASPGGGKTFYLVRHFLTQFISKGATLFVYDFKFDDLTRITYNTFLKNKAAYKVTPGFYVINFDDLSLTHRCNPLEPSTMNDITDASEAARTILLGLNRDWIKKSGEFFTESAINFVTACMWYLRKYKDGIYCTLPHIIELMQAPYDDLFPILGTEVAEEVEALVDPFISAYINRALEQLEGQVASAKIAMARLASPQLYYVLSGDDFTLDINNPDEPKIVCCGNNPNKVQIYGAVLSLFVTRVSRIITRRGGLKSAIVADELPTIFWNGLLHLAAIARGYLVSIVLAIQTYGQLKKDYSREEAEAIIDICGNVVCGQTFGDMAKLVSERIGKIVQQRESVSINRNDTSVSRSTQLESAVPPSRIANLSSGEFVGLVADNPGQKIKNKAFHCEIINDIEGIKAEEAAYKPLPKVRTVSQQEVQNNYIRIKNEITDLIESEMERIRNDPNLSHLLFVKPGEK